MKKIIEYQKLTPLEVAQMGEKDGWPVKGLVVGDDGKKWWNDNLIYEVSVGSKSPFIHSNMVRWKHCARPVERIEWEVGDLVETPHGIYAKVTQVLGDNHVYLHDCGAKKPCPLPYNGRVLKPWTPGYGYTEDGRLIVAPEGYEIMPEGEVVGSCKRSYSDSIGWLLDISAEASGPGWKAGLHNGIRAYARKVEEKTKPEPTITADMIAEVLATLPDCRGDTTEPDGWCNWLFTCRAVDRAEQCQKFADALNKIVRKGGAK